MHLSTLQPKHSACGGSTRLLSEPGSRQQVGPVSSLSLHVSGAQRSPEPLLEVTVGDLQVSEYLFSEMAGLSPKNERIPGRGKIEKDILERWLGDVWKEENEQGERKGDGGQVNGCRSAFLCS